MANEEDSELDAAARSSRLKALVARKRLYFAVLEADEATEKAPIPEKSAELSAPLATIAVYANDESSSSASSSVPKGNALADAADLVEGVCLEIAYLEELGARLAKQRATLFAATREEGGDVFGLGDADVAGARGGDGDRREGGRVRRGFDAPRRELDARRDAVRERGGGDGGCARGAVAPGARRGQAPAPVVAKRWSASGPRRNRRAG